MALSADLGGNVGRTRDLVRYRKQGDPGGSQRRVQEICFLSLSFYSPNFTRYPLWRNLVTCSDGGGRGNKKVRRDLGRW